VSARKRHAKPIAKSNQRLTNLALKKHDDRHADIKERTTEDKLQGSQVALSGKPVKEGESPDRGGHGSGASSTNEFQNCIHKQEHQDQIRDVSRLTKPSQVLRVWQ
jgi:hypothetical protein